SCAELLVSQLILQKAYGPARPPTLPHTAKTLRKLHFWLSAANTRTRAGSICARTSAPRAQPALSRTRTFSGLSKPSTPTSRRAHAPPNCHSNTRAVEAP